MSTIVLFSGSHTDHGLLGAHWAFIEKTAASHVAEKGVTPMIATFDLDDACPDAMSGIYGPIAGDAPVPETEVHYAVRGDRRVRDRMTTLPPRPTRRLTIVAVPEFRAVPEKGARLVCITAYGGELAPQHPDDPHNPDPVAATVFWNQHALSAG